MKQREAGSKRDDKRESRLMEMVEGIRGDNTGKRKHSL